jgi:hypothetical protein
VYVANVEKKALSRVDPAERGRREGGRRGGSPSSTSPLGSIPPPSTRLYGSRPRRYLVWPARYLYTVDARLWYFRGMRIYTFKQAAAMLGLRTASGVSRRIDSLARYGVALSAERGEMVNYGRTRVLTEKGVRRLKEWKGGRVGRPVVRDKEMPVKGFGEREGNQFGLRSIFGFADEEEQEAKEGIKGWDI